MVLEDWDARSGMVSRAFDDWESNAADLRGFFEHATVTSEVGYQNQWDSAGLAVAGTENDQFDVFEIRSSILPRDFSWLLRASVIKDAVSAFDAYLDNAVDEARKGVGQAPLSGPGAVRTPVWRAVVDAYDGLGAYWKKQPDGQAFTPVTVESTTVRYARALRHVLTHRRGQLCNDEDRAQLANLAAPDSDRVRLTDDLVTGILGDLDAAVRSLDPLIWFLACNRRTRPRILSPGQPRTVPAAI